MVGTQKLALYDDFLSDGGINLEHKKVPKGHAGKTASIDIVKQINR